MSTAACPECGCKSAQCTRCGNVTDWHATDADAGDVRGSQ